MPISNFPNGFAQGVNILGLPVLNMHAGNVFWVDSNAGSDGNRGTRDRPFGTLDFAIGRCTADNGDIILVMPNHAETITGVGGIAHDVAGISIIGLGVGAQRPRFLMDGGTTVTYAVSGADAYLDNLVFAAGHSDVVTCFDITATGAKFRNLEFVENTTNENFLVCFKASGAANTADGLTIEGCKRVTVDAGATDFISLIDDIDSLTVRDCTYIADAATGAGMVLCATGKDITGLEFVRNTMICGNTAGDLLIDNDTSVNTGVAAYNLCGHHDVAAAVLIDCDGIRQFENYSTASDTASGIILPVADADSA